MPRASESDKKLLSTLRERYQRAADADQENRARAMEDMKFVHEPGAQWDAQMKQERGSRPCLEFNRLRTTIKRVVNSIRAQRPSGKVRPTEDADKPTAEAYEGLIRNIWANSDGDSVIDTATEYVVSAGLGAWRIATRYSRDDAWDQDIVIEPIANPFCLYRDPAARDPFGSDADYWFLTSRMSRDAYKARWPKADVIGFEDNAEFDDDAWSDEDSVRVVEYWYREPYAETLLLLSDGRTVKQSGLTPEQVAQFAATGVSVVKSREVQCWRVKMVIASGEAILERADWAGSMFPFVMVHGESMVIDGKALWWGLVRHAKDAQRAYNYNRTAQVETVARAPTAKYWATAAQAEGHTEKWAEAHRQNFPVQLYNADPQAPGAPQRMPGADVPAALITLAQIDADDIKATTGIYDASLGNRSNETSGVAIRQRQQEGELSVYNYGDNVSKAVRRTWSLLVDLIPHIYDTQRQIRVLGADGAAKYLAINDGTIDLSRGKYDVTVTTGPSFSTQRQEAAEIYTAFAQGNPAVFPIAGDLIFKSFDLPYADQISERLKTLLPPQIQQMESQQGMAPEVAQAMAQVEQAMQQVQQHGMLVQQAAGEAEQAKGEVDKAIAALEVQRAQFDATVSKAEAVLAKKEAQLIVKEAQVDAQEKQVERAAGEAQANGEEVAAAQPQIVGEVQQAVAAVVEAAAQFMQQAAAQLAEWQGQQATRDAANARPKMMHMRRVNGELQGEVVDAETGEVLRAASVRRIGGDLVGSVVDPRLQ